MKIGNIRICSCFVAILVTLLGCARMGQPDGGWYDDTPPRIVGSTPADKATGVKTKKVTIDFDEFVKLEDATNKVVVSPPQLETPEIKTAGRKIVVELKDTLKENTTYTIDFSDAITDNNESNPMGNYTYSFSTGERIDTFEVSGYVIGASDFEPVKGILVGLYDDLSDTAFTTKPLARVSRTDSRGHFIIKGVAPGTYRVYALQDADGNYLYNQKSEMLAFSHDTYVPTSKPDIRQDTIWRDTLHIDSIARVGFTHFYPDDVVLRAFTAIQTDRYLLKTERQEANKIGFYFSYGNEQLPRLRGLNFNSDSAFVVEATLKRDTVLYWIRDTALVSQDTLSLEATYMTTDTLGTLVSKTDTLEAIAKVSHEKRLKDAEKEVEKWQKEQEKAKKKGLPYDSIMPVAALKLDIKIPSGMAPDQNISIATPTPLARCDTSGIHLYSKIDTLWYRARCELDTVAGRLREYTLKAEWRPGVEYSLEIDSAAFEDIYGLVSKPIKQGIKIEANDNFSSLMVELGGMTDTSRVVVQMLNTSGAVTKQAVAEKGVAEFFYVQPGSYYLSAFVDANGNGQWDTGDYYADRQPETVYFYPKKVECKAKWDVTTHWDVNATPPERQKPLEITKQKPEQEKKLKNRNAERARQLGIPLVKKAVGI